MLILISTTVKLNVFVDAGKAHQGGVADELLGGSVDVHKKTSFDDPLGERALWDDTSSAPAKTSYPNHTLAAAPMMLKTCGGCVSIAQTCARPPIGACLRAHAMRPYQT